MRRIKLLINRVKLAYTYNPEVGYLFMLILAFMLGEYQDIEELWLPMLEKLSASGVGAVGFKEIGELSRMLASVSRLGTGNNVDKVYKALREYF